MAIREKTFLFIVLSLVGRDRREHSDDKNWCPERNPYTNHCLERITENTTCIVALITGCDPDYTQWCRLQIEYVEKPCQKTTCSSIGCCEGYEENIFGECVSEDDIENYQCKNGGTMTTYGMCLCTEHFKGSRCQFPKCRDTCLNGGQCETVKGIPKCICPSTLYSGTFCEHVSCTGICKNGGKCIKDGVLSRCQCTHGYQGDRCQFPINEKCPVVQSKSQSVCGPIRNECESDHDCVNNAVKTACCHNGCKGACRVPEHNPCTYDGKVYNSGETFSPNDCKRCICQMYGEVTCSTLNCNSSLKCHNDQTPVKVDGQCCLVCPGDETTEKDEPRFINCPERFVVLNIGIDGGDVQLPPLALEAVDVHGTRLNMTYTWFNFNHTRQPEISKNIHIVTAYSQCDIYGRRAQCNFRVIVRDPHPPAFETCPADIYGREGDKVSWNEPVVVDNVGLYNVELDGARIRGDTLSAGTYPVSYTAWDYDSNQAICAFMVRIFERTYYDQYADDHFYPKFPTGTVVGIGSGIVITIGLCICCTVRMAKLRKKHEEEHRQRGQSDDPGNSVDDPYEEENADLNDNIEGKLPRLPEYTPRSDPPSYDQIELGVAYKVETPIYEEITETTNVDTAPAPPPENESRIDNGEVNNAYENEDPN